MMNKVIILWMTIVIFISLPTSFNIKEAILQESKLSRTLNGIVFLFIYPYCLITHSVMTHSTENNYPYIFIVLLGILFLFAIKKGFCRLTKANILKFILLILLVGYCHSESELFLYAFILVLLGSTTFSNGFWGWNAAVFFIIVGFMLDYFLINEKINNWLFFYQLSIRTILYIIPSIINDDIMRRYAVKNQT